MRAATFAAVLGLAGSFALGVPARADTVKKPIVWQDRVVHPEPIDVIDGTAALTTVSHKLYLNDCMPNGCTVFPGTDNSLTNRSSIPETQALLSPYGHGSAHWDLLVQCVRDTFAPFDVEIVTDDPGASVSHFEVMIGGSDTQLHPELSAGGVAPFISCGATRNNIISFVFPETTSDLEYLCGAVVQEACHVWGLDHELNALDPMTYLELGTLKRFQNDDADCGEELGASRRCRCGGNTQNSYRYMTNTFGLAPGLAEARLDLITPRDGQWVKPGFPISAQLVSPLEVLSATIKIDTTDLATIAKGPFAVNAPMTLAPGDHVVSVTASDAGDRVATATATIHLMASCASGEKCGSGFHCLGGICLPGSGVDGGLGAGCEDNAECVTGSCGTSGSDSKCTATCDAGETCPSGYECLGATAGAGGVCWPTEGGGCATSGGSPVLLLAGLGALLLARRRRR